MTLSMRRIVLFTKDMPGMVAFYRDVLGLRLIKDEKGWKDIDARGCIVSLHNGTSQTGKRPPKLGFWAPDVAAARAELAGRGAKVSKLMSGGGSSASKARTRTAIPTTLQPAMTSIEIRDVLPALK